MNRKTIALFLALSCLLTACNVTENPEITATDSTPSSAASISASPKTETVPQASKEETTETDITYAPTGTPHPQLMYNGELYTASIYSNQLEMNGEFYEFTGEKAFVDAEKIKKECEYLGVSVPSANDSAREAPTKELETTGSYGETWELYKIDENQILMFNTEKRNITDEIFPNAAYFGEVNDYWIALKTGLEDEIYEELTKKYYRLGEYSEEAANSSETAANSEDKPAPADQEYPLLMYKGNIYYYLAYSCQTEIDGKYYEVSGEPACFDAEKLRNECEYLGKSIPIGGSELPTNELETIYSDETYELYEIDENRILLYSSEPFKAGTEGNENREYQGTYYLHYILVNENVSYEQMSELKNEYYLQDMV